MLRTKGKYINNNKIKVECKLLIHKFYLETVVEQQKPYLFAPYFFSTGNSLFPDKLQINYRAQASSKTKHDSIEYINKQKKRTNIFELYLRFVPVV